MRGRPGGHDLDQGPFRLAQAPAHLTRGVLTGPSFRRLAHGVYQASGLPVDHGVMIEAVRMTGATGVLCGPSAAWAHGCRLAEDPTVHLVVPRGGNGRDARAVVRHRADLAPHDVVDTAWGPATSPARTALDLARGVGTASLPYPRRVARVDALLRRSGLTAAAARRQLVEGTGLRGLPQARLVLAAARDGVDSPKETELRLLVVRFGFPEPQVQCPVADRTGRVLARLDLGWSRWRAGLEYDGAVHLEAGQHSRDLARHNSIRALGWYVLQIDHRSLGSPGGWLRQLGTVVPRG